MTIFVATKEGIEGLAAGRDGVVPIGFPAADVFQFDPAYSQPGVVPDWDVVPKWAA